jgi:hypothetical protein
LNIPFLGNYQHAYTTPYAPRAETGDVENLESNFGNMNLQGTYSHDNSQYAYTGQGFNAGHESFGQDQPYSTSPPPSTTAKPRNSEKPKLPRTGRESRERSKTKGKGHSRKDRPAGPRDDNWVHDPFYRVGGSKAGIAPGQDNSSDVSGSSYTDGSNRVPSPQQGYDQPSSYAPSDYAQENNYPEEAYPNSHAMQDDPQGGYNPDIGSQEEYSDPRSGYSQRREKHQGKQRADNRYGEEEEVATYHDPSAAAPSESYHTGIDENSYPPPSMRPW